MKKGHQKPSVLHEWLALVSIRIFKQLNRIRGWKVEFIFAALIKPERSVQCFHFCLAVFPENFIVLNKIS